MSCACIDKDGIKLTVNSNLQESIVTVRDELLKQGDLYDGFVASIFSVLPPNASPHIQRKFQILHRRHNAPLVSEH